MLKNPDDRKYTKTHEWARDEDGFIEIGITDFAQRQLSDITYVELPAIGDHFQTGKEMIVVESIKAAADVYAPVSGAVEEINGKLADNPGTLNTDPFEEGWLVRIKPDNHQDFDQLMTASDYEAQLPKE